MDEMVHYKGKERFHCGNVSEIKYHLNQNSWKLGFSDHYLLVAVLLPDQILLSSIFLTFRGLMQ